MTVISDDCHILTLLLTKTLQRIPKKIFRKGHFLFQKSNTLKKKLFSRGNSKNPRNTLDLLKSPDPKVGSGQIKPQILGKIPSTSNAVRHLGLSKLNFIP